MVIDSVTIGDGRKVMLDIGTMTPMQGLELATAAADALIRCGMIRDNAIITGPQLIQFLAELPDAVAPATAG